MSREQTFAKVDLLTADLELTGSIYDGFSTAIVVKGQPRTVGLFREYDDAVQMMALIAQARSAAPAQPAPLDEGHRSPDAPCQCFGDSGLQASTYHDTDDKERCDLCGGLVSDDPLPLDEGAAGERERIARHALNRIYLGHAQTPKETARLALDEMDAARLAQTSDEGAAGEELMLIRAHVAWMAALAKLPDDVEVVMTTEQAQTALKAAIQAAHPSPPPPPRIALTVAVEGALTMAHHALLGRKPHSVPNGEEACQAVAEALAALKATAVPKDGETADHG